MKERLRIYTMTHKPFEIPKDPLYVPLQVGSALQEDLGYLRDDTGDNISEKNRNYCELTGLYWAWKNLESDYIGVAHYRRHFALERFHRDTKQRILTMAQAQELLRKTDVVLLTPRNYFMPNIINP